VVIAKLPFPVPDDPLIQGRSERYDDPFREYQLPLAALRLRQGYGRLIRSKTDRGAVVLLDRRVILQDYGPTFLASLPAVRVLRIASDGIGVIVAEHCARDGQVEPPRGPVRPGSQCRESTRTPLLAARGGVRQVSRGTTIRVPSPAGREPRPQGLSGCTIASCGMPSRDPRDIAHLARRRRARWKSRTESVRGHPDFR
jgi:hypothetical protein